MCEFFFQVLITEVETQRGRADALQAELEHLQRALNDLKEEEKRQRSRAEQAVWACYVSPAEFETCACVC